MRKLVLFDWDRTIHGEESPFSNQEFLDLIKLRQSEGWQIGLNSDTPFRRLKNWRDKLGMNGPIIAEKGSVIWWPGSSSPTTVFGTAPLFQVLKKALVQAIVDIPDYVLFWGDNTEFLSAFSNLPGNGSTLVAIDALRLCSLGIFVRSISGNGALMIDDHATQRVASLLAPCVPKDETISRIDFSGRTFGWLGVHSAGTNKSVGLLTLYRAVSFDEVVMVGDSEPDFMLLPSDLPAVRHYAVGNASESLCEISGVQKLNGRFLSGCTELLRLVGR